MSEGEPAPFDGQLMTIEAAVALATEAKDAQEVADKQIEAVKREFRIKADAQEMTYFADKWNWEFKEARYKEALNSKSPFYTHPAFVMLSTLVCATAIFIATDRARD